MSIEAMKQALDALEYAGKDDFWRYQNEAITSLRQAIEQAEKREPVAWMDGYRNIYSLEEKAAGCPEATIPLVPIANQQKTSGSPIFSELHCICGAEWEWHNHDWELVTTPQPQQAEKQEPFGWVSQHTVKGPYEWQFNKELSGVYRDNAISILPLYTTPPQRECEGCDKMAKP